MVQPRNVRRVSPLPSRDAEPPLTARSVLASTLLGADPPDLPVAHLVHMAGLFGINANRARVALSRMATSGEVTTDGAGRYQLTGHLLERQHRQVASRAGTTREWPGTWHVVVVTTAGSGPDVRGERRRALTLARLAERREGVWLRPDNLDLHLGADITGDVAVFTGATTDRPEHTAAVLWDLDGWADRARDLLVRLDALAPSGPGDLAPGFVLSAAVVRHLQADPLLPAPLLPPLWPGADLRRVYDDWDRRYRRVLDRSGPSPG